MHYTQGAEHPGVCTSKLQWTVNYAVRSTVQSDWTVDSWITYKLHIDRGAQPPIKVKDKLDLKVNAI